MIQVQCCACTCCVCIIARVFRVHVSVDCLIRVCFERVSTCVHRLLFGYVAYSLLHERKRVFQQRVVGTCACVKVLLHTFCLSYGLECVFQRVTGTCLVWKYYCTFYGCHMNLCVFQRVTKCGSTIARFCLSYEREFVFHQRVTGICLCSRVLVLPCLFEFVYEKLSNVHANIVLTIV